MKIIQQGPRNPIALLTAQNKMKADMKNLSQSPKNKKDSSLPKRKEYKAGSHYKQSQEAGTPKHMIAKRDSLI